MRSKQGDEMQIVINHMGELSAIAQRLRSPITTISRLLQSFQNLYLLTSNVLGSSTHILAQGILKVGRKNLFIWRNGVQLVEMSPLCVLDFYVHESCQRQGLGHKLFEFMLEQENKRPCQLGYDRPSSKLLSFMAKHHNLSKYESQTNQFVVYDKYFEDVDNGALGKKENSEKEPNRMAVVGKTPREETDSHGRWACPQACDAEEPYNLNHPSRSRLEIGDAKPSLDLKDTPRQPSYHRGSTWRIKQDNPEKVSLDSPSIADPQSYLNSPPKTGRRFKNAYRGEQNEQGKTLLQLQTSNPRSSEPKIWGVSHETALIPCNNTCGYDASRQHSEMGEEERMSIHCPCPPAVAHEMNVTHETRYDPQPIKTLPNVGRLAARSFTKKTSKDPPLSYPFWTEAQELSSCQERDSVDYRRNRTFC
ncbi:uncharacterized protein [Physcomitrium patens]